MTADYGWMQLRSRDKEYGGVFDKPFPGGTEYYRPSTPTPEVWDADFCRISEADLSIVRVWYSRNWVETLPDRYDLTPSGRQVRLIAALAGIIYPRRAEIPWKHGRWASQSFAVRTLRLDDRAFGKDGP